MGENLFRRQCKPDLMILHPAFMNVKDVSDCTPLLVSIKRKLSTNSTYSRKLLKVAITYKHNFLDQITHDIVVKDGVKFVFNLFLHLSINQFYFSNKLQSFVLLLLTF